MEENQIEEIIKLSQNENPIGPSPKAMKAVQEYYDKLHRYPEPHSRSLKEKLANKLYLEPENIFVSAGLVESLDIMIRNFVKPGENMIIGEVTFVAYRLLAEVFGIETRFSKLKEYRMDVNDILNQYDSNTKLIIIANPNNPTGTIISENELVHLLEKVSPDTLVVVDEAYREYVDQADYPNSLGLWDRYKNLIIMRTFSKIYGLAGLRVGYSITTKEIVKKMANYQAPFTVNRLGLLAALSAIDDVEYIEECVRINKEGRETLYNELKACGHSVVPSQSNFLFLSFPSTQERNNILDMFTKRGILVRPTDVFGDDKSLRLTIGTSEHNEKIIECFQSFEGPLPLAAKPD